MKNIIKNTNFLIGLFFTFVIIIDLVYMNQNNVIPVSSMSKSYKVVIVDAGHGGADPGKVAGKILEKDINLQIAKKLKKNLEDNGFFVIMTRETDTDLPKGKKSEMYKRKVIANSSEADIFVSLHQNSSSNSGAKGAQVYYFEKSEKSKTLAISIDSAIKKHANPSKKFVEMPNKSYYVLRQTKMPAVLVECGFMSNSGERWKLTTDEYQEKMASAITNGIIDYFKKND